MKKTLILLLSLTMVFSLAACGGNNGSVPSSTLQASISPEPPPVPNQESSIQTETSDNAENKDITYEDDSNTATPEAAIESTASANLANDNTSGSNILTAYFTVPETDGVDAVSGASRVVVGGQFVGNTQFVAETIQGSIGGDLFQIKTVQEYPGSHNPLLEFAYNEKAKMQDRNCPQR